MQCNTPWKQEAQSKQEKQPANNRLTAHLLKPQGYTVTMETYPPMRSQLLCAFFIYKWPQFFSKSDASMQAHAHTYIHIHTHTHHINSSLPVVADVCACSGSKFSTIFLKVIPLKHLAMPTVIKSQYFIQVYELTVTKEWKLQTCTILLNHCQMRAHCVSISDTYRKSSLQKK